jgi:hypothetical protein
MKMKTVALLFFSSLLFFTAGAADLKNLEEFLSDANVWQIEADKFQDGKNGPYAKWQSEKEKTSARYPGFLSNTPEIKFLGLKVVEAVFRFSEGKLSSVEISLYNRGDEGDMSINDFETKISDISAKIGEWSADKGFTPPKQRLATGIKIEKRIWVKSDLVALCLNWSVTDKSKLERAEYIKLEVFPFDPKNDPRKVSMMKKKDSDIKVTTSASDLKKNVKKDENGNVYLEGIPMVDQGQKGYCAVAVTETVLRYYGTEVDQHVIAQLADTGAAGGTDPTKMYESLKKVSTKFGLKVREHENVDLVKMFDGYNTVAKREKKAKIDYRGMTDPFHQMDLDILRESRIKKDKNGYNNFKKLLFSSIDSGVPVLWGLVLGIVPEPKTPQVGGGHMRAIRGYNKEKNEIIYSDTWGAEHEWKTMNIDDAWAITLGLYTMEPRKKQ